MRRRCTSSHLFPLLLFLNLLSSIPVRACIYKRDDSCPSSWDYGDDAQGPVHWAELCTACGAGLQSPVAITLSDTEDLAAAPVQFTGTSSSYQLRNNNRTLELEVDGSSMPMNLTGGLLGDTIFHLSALHWHSPAEHILPGDNSSAPLEMHLVHRLGSALTVAALQFREGSTESPLLAALMPYFLQVAMPLATQPSLPSSWASVSISSDLSIYASIAPYFAQSYYAYNGSTTTPPCYPNVQWILASQPASASAVQLAALRRVLNGNARPVQAIGKRIIVHSVRAQMSGRNRTLGFVMLGTLIVVLVSGFIGLYVYNRRNAPPPSNTELELHTPVMSRRRDASSGRKSGAEEDPEESEESLTAVLARR